MADNIEKIKCPACNQEMEKLFIPRYGFHLDICTQGCGGIYFDNLEFKNFDEYHENIDAIKKALHEKEFSPVDETAKRICPKCGIPMAKRFSSINMTIQTDECLKCGGKFLDYGELEKIREEYSTEEERTAAFQAGIMSILPKIKTETNEEDKEKNPIKKLCKCIVEIFW